MNWMIKTGDALVMLEIMALAGSLRTGTLAAHKDNPAFLLSFFSFGIVGIILLVLGIRKQNKELKQAEKKRK